jgi:Uma2 family endonuclease
MTIEETLLEQENSEELQKVAGGWHGVIGANFDWYLSSYVRPKNLGWVFNSSTTYNFKDGQPKREPDASFITIEQMPVPPEDEVTIAPDLAVEVVSKNDTAYEIEKKVRQYQQAGVKLIWVAYPISQTIAVYHLKEGLTPKILNTSNELDGEDVLPGFKLKVSAIFG